LAGHGPDALKNHAPNIFGKIKNAGEPMGTDFFFGLAVSLYLKDGHVHDGQVALLGVEECDGAIQAGVDADVDYAAFLRFCLSIS
jgi:hypothetical protein